MLGFPGDLVVKNLPANPGDTGSIPDPRRSHVALEQLNLCVPQLVSLCRRAWGPQFLSPCAPTAEAYLPYSLCPATREASTVRSPRSPQLEKSPCSNDDAAPPKRNKLFKKNCWDFPGYRVVRTLCSQCRRWGFDPWSGNLDSACYTARPRKKNPKTNKKLLLKPVYIIDVHQVQMEPIPASPVPLNHVQFPNSTGIAPRSSIWAAQAWNWSATGEKEEVVQLQQGSALSEGAALAPFFSAASVPPQPPELCPWGADPWVQGPLHLECMDSSRLIPVPASSIQFSEQTTPHPQSILISSSFGFWCLWALLFARYT